MPKFIYQARNLQGEQKSGEAEAKDRHELAKSLRAEGYLLVKAALGEKKKFRISFSLPFFGRVSVTSKLMFARNLKVLVAAGVSLPRSLKILSEQTKSKKLRKTSLAPDMFALPFLLKPILASIGFAGEVGIQHEK